jgi:hypothetical protein
MTLSIATLCLSLVLPFLTEGYVQTAPPKNLYLVQRPVSSNPFGIQLPQFDDLFHQIQLVSPLARSVIQKASSALGEKRGFDSLTPDTKGPLKWKRVESNRKGAVHQIDKLDHFNGVKVPLLRFRSTFEGPCAGDFFGSFILDNEQRQKWDTQLDNVYEIYNIANRDAANIAMGFGQSYGDILRMGVGYGKTKPALGLSPREQLFLYGLQDFPDGSCLLWGQELTDDYNHLLPSTGGPRQARARSHLFSATLTPTGPNQFDVEYCLQLEIGGNVPHFLTTPAIQDSVKSLFKTAQSEFRGESGNLQDFLAQQEEADHVADYHSLLMTP